MDSYKDLYLHMVNETEKAIRILVDAQKFCEEGVLNQGESDLILLPKSEKKQDLAAEKQTGK